MANNYYQNNPFLEDRYEFDENVPGAGFVEIFQNVVIALAILVILYLFVITPNEVNGPSMRETLQDRDLLLTNKIIQVFGGKDSIVGDYQRGDIVTFHANNEDLIKRVIGIAGDRIVLREGKVFLNGEELNETYLADGTFVNEELNPNDSSNPQVISNKDKTYPEGAWLQENQELVVPEGYYFCMGDNRNNSKDSRFDSIRLIKRSDMKGKVFMRILPLSRVGFIGSHDYTN